MFANVNVWGENMHPLWEWMSRSTGTVGIKENWTKFLISPSGAVIGRFRPMARPENLERIIFKMLPKRTQNSIYLMDSAGKYKKCYEEKLGEPIPDRSKPKPKMDQPPSIAATPP